MVASSKIYVTALRVSARGDHASNGVVLESADPSQCQARSATIIDGSILLIFACVVYKYMRCRVSNETIITHSTADYVDPRKSG